MSWGSRMAGGCLASDKGGSDFLAFEEISLLIIRAMPKAANGALSGRATQSWSAGQGRVQLAGQLPSL